MSKKIAKLSKEMRDEIYKEEKKKRSKECADEIKERMTVTFGALFFPLYVLLSSLQMGVMSVFYIVAVAPDVFIPEFVDNPLSLTSSMAVLAISVFLLWLLFGLFSLWFFLQAKKIVKENPEKYKNIKFFNWREK